MSYSLCCWRLSQQKWPKMHRHCVSLTMVFGAWIPQYSVLLIHCFFDIPNQVIWLSIFYRASARFFLSGFSYFTFSCFTFPDFKFLSFIFSPTDLLCPLFSHCQPVACVFGSLSHSILESIPVSINSLSLQLVA